MLKLLIITPLVMIAPAAAQRMPEIPDEQTKVLALKLAYELNGRSMVRWGSIDLSRNQPVELELPPLPKGPLEKNRLNPTRP